ncbi:MAG: glutamine amidotransferase [Acidobacteriaceae bacterium]
MKTAIAIRHIHFEDLGTLEPLLHQRGYQTRYCDIGLQKLDDLEAKQADLLIVLGAPIGVYDEKVYPFLTQELRAIEQRLNDQRPLLGICLGAQLMAHVLGTPVGSMGHKEIGFAPIVLTPAGHKSPLSNLPADTAVLHWHGDQFAIPKGMESLATTPLCPHQAFAPGKNALGLQFHLEADSDRLEPWLVGHASELAQAGVDPCVLRAEAKAHGTRLRTAAQAVFGTWLDQVG